MYITTVKLVRIGKQVLFTEKVNLRRKTSNIKKNFFSLSVQWEKWEKLVYFGAVDLCNFLLYFGQTRQRYGGKEIKVSN